MSDEDTYVRGAREQFETMLHIAENMLTRHGLDVQDAASKLRPVVNGEWVKRKELLRELRKLRPSTEPKSSLTARLQAYDQPVELAPELVTAMQEQLVGPAALTGLDPLQRAGLLAAQAPERWVRNLLKAAILKAKDYPHDHNEDS
jgi:hypothetical protein